MRMRACACTEGAGYQTTVGVALGSHIAERKRVRAHGGRKSVFYSTVADQGNSERRANLFAMSLRSRPVVGTSSARCRSVRAPLRAHRPTTKRPGNEATLCMLEPRIVSPSECVTTILMDLCSVHPYNRTFRTSLLSIASSHYIMFRPLWSSYCSCRIIPHDFLALKCKTLGGKCWVIGDMKYHSQHATSNTPAHALWCCMRAWPSSL